MKEWFRNECHLLGEELEWKNVGDMLHNPFIIGVCITLFAPFLIPLGMIGVWVPLPFLGNIDLRFYMRGVFCGAFLASALHIAAALWKSGEFANALVGHVIFILTFMGMLAVLLCIQREADARYARQRARQEQKKTSENIQPVLARFIGEADRIVSEAGEHPSPDELATRLRALGKELGVTTYMITIGNDGLVTIFLLEVAGEYYEDRIAIGTRTA